MFTNNYYYHVFNKTLDKLAVFSSPEIISIFMKTIQYYNQTKRPSRFSIYRKNGDFSYDMHGDSYVKIAAFCMMPNHFHFLVKQVKDKGISTFFSLALNSFTRYYNIHVQRVGNIFLTPFHATEIRNRSQLLHVSRYIHLNPYTARFINTKSALFEYPFSSITAYTRQKNNKLSFIYTKDILSHQNEKQYIDFVWGNAKYQRKLQKAKMPN